MKKYFSILICLVPLFGYAQPVLTYNSHGLMPETANIMLSVDYVSPGDVGVQVVWDFKHAHPIKDATLIKESISQVNSHDILITNLKDGKFSYTSNAQGNIYNGYQEESFSMIFDKPIKKIAYPFTYGDKISGHFSGHIFYNNSNMEFSRTGTYSTEADAIGTMVMPSGQVLKNVLRLKVVEKYVQKACGIVEIEIVKYAWYIEEYRYPIFVIFNTTHTYPDGKVATQHSACVTTASLNQVADEPVYESENQPSTKCEQVDIEHSVYPNPYSDILHITYTLDKPTTVNISLYSLSGNLISKIIQGKVQDGVQHITYTSKEITGTYYLRLQFGDKVYVRALVKN
ncbi:MAG: T9SS type A sorting domain-containing protein [Prevotellaceae bacterium]|jgi:hypothetical protein|nr:T9SS type A sorting domain-containing protein [Prevotellaceae bacterium]